MVNWKKIADLNLKEVASKTQIEFDFLQALVEKDFQTLHRFNVRGFIKILSREYELDFSDFLEEYENYLNENNLSLPIFSNKTITPKLDSYTQKSSSSWIWIIIVVVIVLVAAGLYYLDSVKFFLQQEESNSSTAVVEIIGEAKDNLKDLDSNIVVQDQENNKSEENLSQTQENINSIPKDDTNNNTTAQGTQELNTTNIQNNQNTDNLDENNSSQSNENKNTDLTASNQTQNNVVSFKPNVKVWVGVIDLSTFRKTSSVKEGEFELPLEKDQLVLTGAAAFEITNEEGQTKTYPAGSSKRFLIKDGKITNISLADFKRLNRGKEW